MRGSLSIRSLRVLLAPASVCLLLAGCAQPAPTPTPDPRIDDLQDAVSRVGQTLERLEGEVERLANAPTPTPGPSLKQVDARISQAIAAIPTGTPTPVPPPSVTFEEARSLMDEAIETSVAMALAAMSGPPGTVREAHVSGGVDVSMFGEVSLRIEPGQPMAGHDVSFTLTGLDPWQPVALSFRDPTGRSAEWIAPTETRFAWIDGSPITGQWFHADEEGSLSWTRIGTLDREGTWSVVVAVDGVDYPVEYPVMDLPLPKPESAELGVELRRYRGSVSDTYTSALVPAALTIDLQSYLVWTMVVLSSEMGIARTSQIPDLYLAGSGDALDRIREEIGFDVPIEPDGFYSDVGGNPAVYIRTDYPLTSILRLLTHEYVHLALDEMSGGVRLPAWIDEGLATYAEYSLGLRSVRPDATRAQMYASIDVVKDAAESGTLFPLTSLESGRDWNLRGDTDLVRLQYAQSYMAVRYFIERFGSDAVATLVDRMAEGDDLPAAFEGATGVAYSGFRDDFQDRMAAWTDPEREELRAYVHAISGIMSREQEVSTLRERGIKSDLEVSQRLANALSHREAAQDLRSRVQALSPPAIAEDLDADAAEYFDKMVEWLGLEVAYLRAPSEEALDAANAMLDEINARESGIYRTLQAAIAAYRIE